MKKLITISSFAFLALTSVVFAATNDFIADADITVSGVTFGSTTTDMTIMNGSAAESWEFNNGILTVTNGDPTGPFKVGSSDANVKSIYVMNGTNVSVCQENTAPGTSFATVPASAGVLTVEPSANTNCQAHCTQLAGVATYNHFPTCGAETCAIGYHLSGNGSTATCIVNSMVPLGGGGGGGGGGGSVPYVDPNNSTTTLQSFVVVEDGTKVTSEIVAVKTNGVTVKTQVIANIDTVASTSKEQSIMLDSFLSSQIKKMTVVLPPEVIQDIVNRYGFEKDIKVMIVSHDATETQKTSDARSGMFLIGFDVFSVYVTVGDVTIKEFVKPLTLNFDVSNFFQPDNFKVSFYNETSKKWENVPGATATNGIITVTVDHLTDFGIMREMTATPIKEVVANKFLQWQQIMQDAAYIMRSGTNLDEMIAYVGSKRDAKAQTDAMKKYTNVLIKGLKNLKQNEIYAINNYIVHGSKMAPGLNMKDRYDVLGSYKKAYGKIPKTEKEWTDCLAVSNGRKPNYISKPAEANAAKEFKKIYKRNANMNNAKDVLAIDIIAYGIRPLKVNASAEAAAKKTFKSIYRRNASTITDMDIVRGIAYSGAKR